MIFIEPTPYIVGLVKEIQLIWKGEIEVIYLQNNFSQNWDIRVEGNHHILLTHKYRFIYKKIRESNYKLFFIAGWSNPISIILMILGSLLKIPVLVDSDTPLFNFTPSWKKIVKRIIYPQLFKIPTLFLPAGKRQAKYLRHYNVPAKKIWLEHMTVDVTRIQNYIYQLPQNSFINLRNSYGLLENDFVFLFVGRLIERKGLKELLNAFSQIKGKNIKLLIIGDGDLRPYVEQECRMSKNIMYLGWHENEKLLNIFYISNAIVLPAHWEPWGLVINEAMAAGKPVIVSDQVGCVDDLVIQNETGIIIKNKSIHELTQAMDRLAIDTLLYKAMSKNVLNLIEDWRLADEAKNICTAMESVMQS